MPVIVERGQSSAAPTGAAEDPARGAPRLRMTLRPYKSLTPEGFVWFIGLTSGLIMLPLFNVLGTSVFWALLPFLLGAVWAIWLGLKRSWRDMDLWEELTLWDDMVRIVRHDPRRAPRNWEANPYWVQIRLHERGGPVPNYLTLRGAGREVELGAFLTPAERVALKNRLEHVLRG